MQVNEFVNYPEYVQKSTLLNMLNDIEIEDGLVESIIQSAKKVSHVQTYNACMSVAKNTLLQLQVLGVVPVPLEMQIEKGELAPSTVKPDEIISVARIILHSESDFRHLFEFVHNLPDISDVVTFQEDTLSRKTRTHYPRIRKHRWIYTQVKRLICLHTKHQAIPFCRI